MSIPGWCSRYVGIPYDELTCWSLVKAVYKDIYDIEIAGIREQRDLVKSGFWYEVENEFQTGDVLVFKESHVKRHVGLLLTPDHMLHADQHCGTIIDRWVGVNWKPRLDSIYRCNKLAI